jgi:hypothetical protein
MKKIACTKEMRQITMSCRSESSASVCINTTVFVAVSEWPLHDVLR